MTDCLISFGSNLGDSKRIISKAMAELRNRLQKDQSADSGFHLSEFFETQPIGGPESQHVFINGAARFQSQMEPAKLLQLLHDVERLFGRERRIRWDSRTLDLDLLIYGDSQFLDGDFQVPHPRMCFRQFVLRPAVQIAPKMQHPVCGVSLETLLDCINCRESDILLVTSPDKQAELESMLADQILSGAVTFVSWNRLPGLLERPSEHKLVVLDLAECSPSDFLRTQSESIHWQQGPVMLLNDEPCEQILTELSAATEAMKAI